MLGHNATRVDSTRDFSSNGQEIEAKEGSNQRSIYVEAGTVLLRAIKERKVLMRKGMISSNEVKLERKAFEGMKLGLGPKQARKPIIERRLKQAGKSRKRVGKNTRIWQF